MNKKVVISLVIIVVLIVAYLLISPLWNNIRLDEGLPVASPETATTSAPTVMIKDSLESMGAAEMEKFKRETEKMEAEVMMKKEVVPAPPKSAGGAASQPIVLSQAPMLARAHDVAGKALLVQSGDQKILRFEDLKTINGPDLRIYLASDLSNEDVIDLGPIRATEGNVNYVIPASTDTNKYKNALIWCRAFGVLFSYAQL